MILEHPKFNWHLEISSKCSLACPRCPRTEKPEKFKITELNLSFIKKVFTKEILNDTISILFCGGQGDPIYCKDLIPIIKYIKDNNSSIGIKITTNGSYKTKNWWEDLSNVLNEEDTIIFSIDGWDNESNNKYRINSNFDSILLGLNTVSKNKKINIIWSTIVFSFNENELNNMQLLAEKNGATHFQIVQSSLFGSKVSSYNDPKLGYDPLEPTYKGDYWHSDRGLIIELRSKKLSNSVTNFRKKVKETFEHVFKNFENLNILPGCLLGERGLYIDAEGILYPCSWISHPFGERSNSIKTIKWENSLFVKYKNNFNLHNYALKDILVSEHWNKLYSSFYNNKKQFVECSQKCSKKATLQRLEKVTNRKLYIKNDVYQNLENYNN